MTLARKQKIHSHPARAGFARPGVACAGGGASILGSRLLTKFREDLNPAIAVLNDYFPTLDLPIKLSQPDLRANIADAPVTYVVALLGEEDIEVTRPQFVRAVVWMAEKFNFRIHQAFNPEREDERQTKLAQRVEAEVTG